MTEETRDFTQSWKNMKSSLKQGSVTLGLNNGAPQWDNSASTQRPAVSQRHCMLELPVANSHLKKKTGGLKTSNLNNGIKSKLTVFAILIVIVYICCVLGAC